MISSLALARIEANLSQAELAKKMGVTQSCVSKIESKNFEDLEIGSLCRYLNALGLQLKFKFKPKD